MLGQRAHLDGVPRHESPHRLLHQRVRTTRARQNLHKLGLDTSKRRLRTRRDGRRVAKTPSRTTPHGLQAHPLIHQVIEYLRDRRRPTRVEPQAYHRRVRGDDLDVGASQRTEELWLAPDRKVELDTPGRQVPLNVR